MEWLIDLVIFKYRKAVYSIGKRTMPKPRNLLRFGSAIFCNSVTHTEQGKIDCSGIFTSFYAWAFPTVMRSWYAVFTIFDFPKGKYTFDISMAYGIKGRGKKEIIASSTIELAMSKLGNTINIRLSTQFRKPGDYVAFFILKDTNICLKVPFRVVEQKWPKLTAKEIAMIQKKPTTLPHAIRAGITCAKCSSPYTFEESYLPGYIRPRGVLPFPPSGIFLCENCGRPLHIKDLYGQMLNSVKAAVQASMKGGA